MSRGILTPFFPATQRDVSRLKQSATDAVNDFSSAAATHAGKVRSRLRDLATHLRSEGRTNFSRAQASVLDTAASARDFARERPLTCMAGVLAIGLLMGLCYRGSAKKAKD